jgi:endonuclease YncB( thermonuclease family)
MPRRRTGNRAFPAKLTPKARRATYLARKGRWFAVALLAAVALFGADRVGLFGRHGGRGLRSSARIPPPPPGQDEARYDGVTFRVGHVVDGDTIDVDMPDGQYQRTRIRLWGVDTPETKDPRKGTEHFGPEASAFTRRLCEGKDVRLQLVRGKDTRDRYGRVLAYVILPDGAMLNRELVRQGYAYADPRFPHPMKAEFRRLEKQAEDSHVGLWKDVRGDDLPYYHPDRPGGPQAPIPR